MNLTAVSSTWPSMGPCKGLEGSRWTRTCPSESPGIIGEIHHLSLKEVINLWGFIFLLPTLLKGTQQEHLKNGQRRKGNRRGSWNIGLLAQRWGGKSLLILCYDHEDSLIGTGSRKFIFPSLCLLLYTTSFEYLPFLKTFIQRFLEHGSSLSLGGI